MKYGYLLLLAFLLSLHAQAQLASFSTDPVSFMKELDDFMKANNNEIGKDSYNRFAKEVEALNITAEQLDMVINLSNNMLDRKMKPMPQFVAVLDATVAFSQSGQMPERYSEWMDITNSILDNSKKGSYVTFNRFLEFSAAFFEKSALNDTPTKTWCYGAFDYQFKLNGEIPEVHFPSTQIYAYTKGDTMSISETGGVYFPLQKEWKGKGGYVVWTRAGLDSTLAFAKLGNYTVNTESNEYIADSATLNFGGLFGKPLIGQLNDKLITNNEPEKSNYPQFRSYDVNLSVKDIVSHVDYTGGFLLKGGQIIGSGNDSIPAEMRFREPSGKLAMIARSQTFLIEPGTSIYSKDAEVIIRLAKVDSIYHHDVSIRYDAIMGNINVVRQNEGFSSLMYYSSYHKIDAKVDNLNWTLGDSIIRMKNITGAGNKMSWFESQDLFSMKLFDRVRGVASYQPLVKIKRYCETYKTRVIPTLALAKELNPSLTVDGVQSLLLQLVEEGFIFYDKENELVYVKDKTFNYVLASAQKKDYDIINIPSVTKDANAELNLNNFDLTINGINQFYLSDSQFVLIYPANDQIIMKKNRDMLFDGTIVSGSIDFKGNNFFFSYDTFSIKMNKVDSMILYVESTEIDDLGNPLYLPVNTNISVSSGRLQIDKTDNKSSMKRYPEYSIFTTYDYSIADYDKPTIFSNVYDKEAFYFKLDPFTLLSSDSLDYRDVKFEGAMVSAGIFPDFREALKLQEDRSLGFKTTTPAGGFPTYGKMGKYNGNLFMSNQGFRGTGTIDFMASRSESKDIIFFPDSTLAKVDDFVVAKTESGIQFPATTNTGVTTRWLPYEDKMIVQQGIKPFDMFESQSTLQGTAIVTSKGLRGDGAMFWGEVKLKSNQFSYLANNAQADTSSVSIGQVTPDLVALKLDNVNTDIEFKKRIGHFKANSDTIMTELPYNEYKTDMNQFDWIMDERVVYFKSDKEFSNFYSTNGNQDSLVFQAKAGKFDLNTYLLKAEGVPMIKIADVHVIPDSGRVQIEKGAKMGTLYYAKILGDTLDFHHQMENCVVNITGRFAMSGTGNYTYTSPQGLKQNIPIESMNIYSIADSIMGTTAHHMLAKGYVQDSANFLLENKVHFKGPVELYSHEKLLRYRGYVKLEVMDTANIRTSYFRIDSRIDPKNPIFNLDDAVTERDDSVYAGIFRFNDTAALYTNIMGKKASIADYMIFSARGKGYYNETDQTFYFGNLDKLNDPGNPGSIMKYNDKTGALFCEGRLRMGLKTDMCDTRAYGTIIKRPNNTNYRMESTVTLSIPLPEELMNKLGEMLLVSNSDAGAAQIDYNTETLLNSAISDLFDEKSFNRIMSDLTTKGYATRPKDNPVSVFVSGLKLAWDPSTRSFHSTSGDAKLVWFGDKSFNQQIKCYAEFGKRSGGDYFTLYFLTPSEDFVYIYYRRNQLKLYTSRDDLNGEILSYDNNKRVIETDKGNMVFSLEGKNAVGQFLQDMQYYENLKENK